MKRFFLLALAAFSVCFAMTAQNAGDKYIAASLAFSFGNQNVETSNDGVYSTMQSAPLATSVGLQAELGYFSADNFRLGLCLGIPFNSTPESLSGTTWLKTKTVGFSINPNIAYYLPLADRLYYTPEIGFSYEIGSYKEDLTTSTTYNANYSGWDLYVHILALEYRVSPKFAIGVGIGSVSYANAKIKDKNSGAYISSKQFSLDFNSSTTHARFYF